MSEAILRVVRGEPTAEELAVLAALMSVSGGGDEPEPAPTRGRWNDPARAAGAPVHHGPGAWRAALR